MKEKNGGKSGKIQNRFSLQPSFVARSGGLFNVCNRFGISVKGGCLRSVLSRHQEIYMESKFYDRSTIKAVGILMVAHSHYYILGSQIVYDFQ